MKIQTDPPKAKLDYIDLCFMSIGFIFVEAFPKKELREIRLITQLETTIED